MNSRPLSSPLRGGIIAATTAPNERIASAGPARQCADPMPSFQLLFDLAPVAIWVTRDAHVIHANRACAALFGGADADTLQGRPMAALLHAGALAGAAIDALAPGATTVAHERIARADGAVLDVEIAVTRLPDPHHTMLQMALTDITQRRQAALALEQSRLDLRDLAENQMQAREDERRRIARELHDELGQQLTALKMDLSSLLEPAPDEAGERHARVVDMLATLDATVGAVRRIARDLRPLLLDDLGLNAAIEWLARDAARRMGIEVTVRLGEHEPPIDERAAIALFRMVQEALTNVARHARATDVNIEMDLRDDTLILSVHDNGIGFAPDAARREGSYGLMGLHERAGLLGGRIVVDNPRGGGGRVTFHLPLQATPQRGSP